MAENSIHSGHRKRIRESFLKRDIDSMQEHEVLELLLFYSIPRGDTNPIAHRLIDEFGSLKNVLNAPHEELVRTDGVGESTAVMLNLVSKIAVKYLTDITSEKEPCTYDEIVDMLFGKFTGLLNEKVEAVFLDSAGKYINSVTVSEGELNDVNFKPRKLAGLALRCNASKVILSHNHPNGFAVPSQTDVSSTREVREILLPLEINLIDHIIIAGKDAFSMKNSAKYSFLFI